MSEALDLQVTSVRGLDALSNLQSRDDCFEYQNLLVHSTALQAAKSPKSCNGGTRPPLPCPISGR